MQITTVAWGWLADVGCYLWCKDTNFNANHNCHHPSDDNTGVVIYGAKILILMQITTNIKQTMMTISCYLWCKDTNFNANHNIAAASVAEGVVVIYGAKILILMQITTLYSWSEDSPKLLFMVQRY